MKKFLKSILWHSGYKISGTKYVLKQFLNDDHILKLNFDHIISNCLLNKPDPDQFSFIQIGAFDGVVCDPLRKYLLKYNWNGVMLEPQPVPYAKLKSQYEDRNNLIIINAALDKVNSTMPLFILEGEGIPEWSKGMASFDKQNILKHANLIPNLKNYVKQIEVKTVTFDEILSTKSLVQLDLLQVDTEGFDAEIILMFPFNILKPGIIHFESKHIPKARLEQLLDILIAKGYYIARDGEEDMLAILA